MPKIVDIRRHCEVELRACNNIPQPQKNRDVGIGLRKIVACSHSSPQCLLVSTVFGTVSSLHHTSFLMIFMLVSLIFHPGAINPTLQCLLVFTIFGTVSSLHYIDIYTCFTDI